MNRQKLFLLLAACLIAACGDRGSDSQDKNSQKGRVGFGYDDGYGPNGFPGGVAVTPLNGTGLGNDTLQGSGPDGQLSAAETQALMQYVENLSATDRSQMQSVLLNNLRQCAFPPAGASTVASCRSGNGQACAQAVSGYALGYLAANAAKMGMSGADAAYMNAMSALCAAVDLNNATAVQTHIKSKSYSCKAGDRRACVGLLMFLARLFMKALMMVFAML